MTEARETPQLGTTRYTLLSVLGEGAMATVYRARDEVLGVDRAIKLMASRMVHEEEARARFLNEARVMASLAHPHVVRVVDAQLEGDRPYLVMELVRGGSLDLHVEHSGSIHPSLAIRLLREVLDGLGAAHEQGVVHRDVKPQNILLTLDGEAKVTDFGVAHVADGHRGLTRTGSSLGTLAYLAPEQRIDASAVDHRADLFAAGATLYHLVTGREPFDLYASERREQNYKEVPTKLAAVIARACAYEPEERYSSAKEMAVALDQVSWSIPRKKGAKQAMLAWAGTIAAKQEAAERLPAPAGGLTTPPSWGWDASGEGGEPAEGTLPGRKEAGLPPWIAVLGGGLLSLVLAGAALLLVLAQPWDEVGEESPTAAEPELVEALQPLPQAPVIEAPEEPEDELVEGPSPKQPRVIERPATVTRPRVRAPDPAPREGAVEQVESFLNSRPWSRVALDGAEVGSTLFKRELAPGTHDLKMTTADGRTHRTRITVTAGESLRYCWDFDTERPCAR